MNTPMHAAWRRRCDDAISDVDAAVRTALDGAGISFASGARIAVAVGSRGIGSIDRIVKSALEWLSARGARPFIVPAMGSHGGATAEGQTAVLASYGITEETMNAPIRSSMETVALDARGLEVDLFMDRHAWESDGVLLVNRVKPHTDFHGFPESGLLKMSVIGLGKHAQALAVHGLGIRGLKEQLLPAARRILSTRKILGGLAIVENADDEPMAVRAAAADRIEPLERELLRLAGQAIPSLPLDDIDLLIVDQMGKDKSGTGLDTGVIGRIRIHGEPEPERPRVRSLVVLSLTEASHGNAIGIGLADVITRELYDAIDFRATYENGLTSSFSERVKVPYVAADHRDAIRAAIRFAGLHADPVRAIGKARIARIRSTLDLSSMLLSAPACDAVGHRDDLVVAPEPSPLFGADGRLPEEYGRRGGEGAFDAWCVGGHNGGEAQP